MCGTRFIQIGSSKDHDDVKTLQYIKKIKYAYGVTSQDLHLTFMISFGIFMVEMGSEKQNTICFSLS